jgi:dCTP deaminase
LILSDRDIVAAMQREHDPLIIDPPVPEHAIQPASVDITLGDTFEGWTYLFWRNGEPVGEAEPWSLRAPDDPDWVFELKSGQRILATVAQTIQVPTDMCAQLSGKSSLGRIFLTNHATAGFIDPGFQGAITLELKNDGYNSVYLHVGMAIGQLIFTQLTSRAVRPYGSKGLNSHYQGQAGATRSYLEIGN